MQAVEERLGSLHVRRYVDTRVEVEAQHRYVQSAPGRPGANTRYRRVTKRQLRLRWTIDEVAIAYDQKSDGMYPLLTNDRSLTPEQVGLDGLPGLGIQPGEPSALGRDGEDERSGAGQHGPGTRDG